MAESTMTEEERNRLYRSIADSFINVANQHAEQQDTFMISSAFLYGAARFCAFATAVNAKELEVFEADQEPAIEYFTAELRRMLTENMDSYREAFKPAPPPTTMVHKYVPQKKQEPEPERFLKYDHLVKK